MKFAKLEIKIIVAMLLTGYEYDVVNERGDRPDRLPDTDFNDIHQVGSSSWSCTSSGH